VGAGMKSHPGIAANVFSALAEAGINVEMISTSTIRISCVVRASQLEDAVRALHEAFRLDTEDVA
jgi:aspartate kinase